MGCGPQIAMEEDRVVKLGPLVAVVVVEAAACCLLSAACPSPMLRHHASLCLLPYKTATSALPIVGLRENEGEPGTTDAPQNRAGCKGNSIQYKGVRGVRA